MTQLDAKQRKRGVGHIQTQKRQMKHLSSFALHPAVPSGEGLQLGCTTAKGTRTDSSLYLLLPDILYKRYIASAFNVSCIVELINASALDHMQP